MTEKQLLVSLIVFKVNLIQNKARFITIFIRVVLKIDMHKHAKRYVLAFLERYVL